MGFRYDQWKSVALAVLSDVNNYDEAVHRCDSYDLHKYDT